MSPARTSIGTICTRVSDMDVVRPRGPGPGRVLTQRAREHPAQRGALTHGARARGALDLDRDAAHELDACVRHPHERATRHARARHLAPMATPKRALASRYAEGMYTRSRWIALSVVPASAETGKSTSSDSLASWPGSSRSLPELANLMVGSLRVSSSLIGRPWASTYRSLPATRRTVWSRDVFLNVILPVSFAGTTTWPEPSSTRSVTFMSSSSADTIPVMSFIVGGVTVYVLSCTAAAVAAGCAPGLSVIQTTTAAIAAASPHRHSATRSSRVGSTGRNLRCPPISPAAR